MKARPRLPGRRMRGLALLFTLIALAVMLAGALSLIRALDVGLLQAGQYGQRRDLINQAERGFAQARLLLASGALSTEAARRVRWARPTTPPAAWPAMPRAFRRCC